ncbi:hypothetical protein JTB14_013369 [Gonioctena quinquepunctata]|nr:hypothetical protein JTB14_013369 [Gonioctena quinquepunctata]
MCGDLGSNWRKFKNNFSLFSIATGCEAKAKEVQTAVLLHCLGEEAYEVLETLDLTANERTDPDKIIEQLYVHFLPESNPSLETHKFTSFRCPLSCNHVRKDCKKQFVLIYRLGIYVGM